MPTITDATVVAQAYDTSGNGGRKLVRLDSGALVAAAKDTTSQFVWKTTDNWNTKTVIASQTGYVSSQDVALCTDGKNIFRLFGYNNSAIVFNSWTESGVILNSLNLDTGQTALGNVSLAINEAKTELHAVWASKNSILPSNFNIRYAKGTINSDGTVTWGSVEKVTDTNNSSINIVQPSIVVDSRNNAYIISRMEASLGTIICFSKNISGKAVDLFGNTGFGNSTLAAQSSYAQYSPSAIYVPQSINGLANGLIATAWHGLGETHTTTNYIHFSRSTDGGTTWSTMQKLVPGTNASLTANKAGKLFITYEDAGVTKRIESSDNGDTWSSAITVGNGTNPSTLFDLSMSFSAPLTIRKGASSVLFSGTWTTTTISVTPGDIGQIQDKNNILFYSITTDGEMSTITEKINGTVVNTRTANSGDAITLGLTQEQWDAIRFGRYADATGGKNTLTVEMGTDKWTYTFDKRLATEADILSAVKATQDANEVYLPSVKKLLSEAINSKGGSTTPNDSFEVMARRVKESRNIKNATGTITSGSTTTSFLNATGSSNSYSYISFDFSSLDFVPSYVFVYMTNKSTTIATLWSKNNIYETSASAYSNVMYGANSIRSPYSNGVVNLPVYNTNSTYTWVAYE